MTDDNDLAIRLNVDIAGPILTCAEIGSHQAVAVKPGIQASVGIKAGNGEVIIGAIVTEAHGHDLSVRLDYHAGGLVAVNSEIYGRDPVSIEGGVEAPIRVVAGDGEFFRCAIVAPSHGHNLAVRLKRDVANFIGQGADIGGDDAIGVESRVQGSIGAVTHHQEVAVCTRIAGAAHDDLAVGLHNDAH